MIETGKIYNESGQGFTRIFSTKNVENVNPVEFYKKFELKKRAIAIRDLISARDPFLASILPKKFFLEKAQETLTDFFEQFETTKVPKKLLQLLESNKKNDQIKLLRGIKFDPYQLMAFIFKSYEDYDYLYSKYSFENLPDGFQDKILPKLFQLNEDGSVHKVGETDLTDGELKHIIEHRKVIVAHMFSKEDNWHCFFLTFRSIAGKENWKDGQAHHHYISSAFGVSREEFIASMKSGKYKSTPVHIDLTGYGHQTDNKEKSE